MKPSTKIIKTLPEIENTIEPVTPPTLKNGNEWVIVRLSGLKKRDPSIRWYMLEGMEEIDEETGVITTSQYWMHQKASYPELEGTIQVPKKALLERT